MFLKNYTSDVPVTRTIARIEEVLIRCGVLGISKEYSANARVTAITFKIHDNGREFEVRLPAKEEEALEALWKNYVSVSKTRRMKTKESFRDQAQRTAWKIVQDWVEVQMSMVQLRQADVVEVFLSYIWDPQDKSTVFHRLKSSGYRLLLPEKT